MGDEIVPSIADILKTIERWVIAINSKYKLCGVAVCGA